MVHVDGYEGSATIYIMIREDVPTLRVWRDTRRMK
jgi:hypothetical protein